ncbi:MAG: efflux RND transporter periplasmic adaptor subunit [Burkholderiales bacterium]|nr:efflux RND transporter periplasmic adaptor subunit [Burkholderiales bacterium]
MKRLFIVLAAAVLLAASGYFWKYHASPRSTANVSASAGAPKGAPGGKGPAGGMPVKVGKVATATIREEVNAVGTLLASESVMIRPERDGRIAAIHFAEGALVRAGEKLVSLDTAEIEAQLAAADSELTLNRSRLERAEELRARKFISAQALDDAREAVNQSTARRAEVKARLDKSAVIAPFEGVAGLRQVSPGAYVKAGQDIARLEGIGTLKLDFRVPEVYAGRIRAGQELAVRLDAWPGESFRGEVYAIEPAVDEATRTMLVRARVPNPAARLKPGMFSRVVLALATREAALVVPEQALVPKGDARYVYRLADGRAVLTKIETGLRRPGEVEVRGGLAAGDTIIIDGQLRLQDGAPVAVLPEKPAAAATR